jgi:hypothetical protein
VEIKLDVYINDSEINIQFDDNQSTIKILDASNLDFKVSEASLYFLLNENEVRYIGQLVDNYLQKDKNLDKVIIVTVPPKVNLEYLEYAFIKEVIQDEITLVNKQTLAEPKISENQKSDTNEYKDKILFILKSFGYDLFKLKNNEKLTSKSGSGKARHKWSKEISKIKFIAKLKGGEGEAIWQKKDELVLLSGAKLVADPQMNKDGTMNYSAQFAQKLRLDHLDKIVDNVTIADIVFPSPNQLGIFLFFGGQNTWVELKDSNGKSLDDWSRVD